MWKNRKMKEVLLLQNKQKLEQYQARFLHVCLFVLVGGYLFFFSSPFWMPPDYSGVTASRIGEEQQAENRTIRLMKWDYCETQQNMEVILEIDSQAIDGIEHYTYRVMERNQGMVTATPVIERADLVVLHLENLPRKWAELSLQMRLPESKASAMNESGELGRFYTTRKDVHRVKKIEVQAPRQYEREVIEQTIQIHVQEIQSCEQRIAAEKQTISEAEETIRDLRSELKFETETEQLETQEQIHSVEAEEQAARERIQEQEQTIRELQEQNRLLKEKEKTI